MLSDADPLAKQNGVTEPFETASIFAILVDSCGMAIGLRFLSDTGRQVDSFDTVMSLRDAVVDVPRICVASRRF